MKKFTSTAIAFLIIWAFTFVMVVLISFVTGRVDTHDLWFYLIIGFSGALGGVLGPKISGYIKKRFK